MASYACYATASHASRLVQNYWQQDDMNYIFNSPYSGFSARCTAHSTRTSGCSSSCCEEKRVEVVPWENLWQERQGNEIAHWWICYCPPFSQPTLTLRGNRNGSVGQHGGHRRPCRKRRLWSEKEEKVNINRSSVVNKCYSILALLTGTNCWKKRWRQGHRSHCGMAQLSWHGWNYGLECQHGNIY